MTTIDEYSEAAVGYFVRRTIGEGGSMQVVMSSNEMSPRLKMEPS